MRLTSIFMLVVAITPAATVTADQQTVGDQQITFEIAPAPSGGPASITAITMSNEPDVSTKVSVRNTSTRNIRRVTVQARVTARTKPSPPPTVFTSAPLPTLIAPGQTVDLVSGLLDAKAVATVTAAGSVTAAFSISSVEFSDGEVWSAQAAPIETAPQLGPVGPEPYDSATPGIIPPKVTYQSGPRYTPEAMRAKIQGLVEMRVVVGRDGIVKDARVSKSLDADYGLDLEAIKTVTQWKFTPGTFNGKPVATVVTIKMEFRLH